jgi:hypothetical protein
MSIDVSSLQMQLAGEGRVMVDCHCLHTDAMIGRCDVSGGQTTTPATVLPKD